MSTTNETIIEIDVEDNRLHYRVKFFVLIILEIPSILLSVLIFIFFFTHRPLFQVLQHHALLILLVVNFIQVTLELPLIIHFYRLGRVSPATPGYCTWWTFVEFTLNVSSAMLMASISLQRHLLVFHSHVLHIRSYRLLFHHLPLLFCVVYPIILYLIIVVFYPCDGTQWNYNSNVCGLANCYLIYNQVLSIYDWLAEGGLPVLVIGLANAALIVRVIRQKRRRQQLVSWRKQRRMTLQLLSISCLYVFTWFPNLCIAVVQQLFIPTFLDHFQSVYTRDLYCLICLLMPWVCIGLFPEFLFWIQKSFTRQNIRQNTVVPTNHLTL